MGRTPNERGRVGAAIAIVAALLAAGGTAGAGGFKKSRPAKGKAAARAARPVERLEVALDRADILDAPRPDAKVIGFVVKTEVMPKLDTSADGNYFKVRYGPFDEGWVDVVAVHESSKPLKMVEAKGRVGTGVAGKAVPAAHAATPTAAAGSAPAPAPKPAPTAPPPKAGSPGDVRADAGDVARDAGAAPDDAAGAGASADAPAPDAAALAHAAAPPAVDRITLGARAGYATFAERFDSDGTGPFNAYRVRFNQAVAELAATLAVHPLLSLDVRYALGYSLPTDVTWTDGSNVHLGTASHRFDVGAALRLRLSEALGLTASLRVGFMVTRFEMVAVAPDTSLLTNTYYGAVAGARLEATRLVGGLGVGLGVDALLPAWMSQGPYASGTGDASRGLRASVSASWTFTPRFMATAGWSMTYLHTRFWGDGTRETGTNDWARNDDFLQTFEVGARVGF